MQKNAHRNHAFIETSNLCGNKGDSNPICFVKPFAVRLLFPHTYLDVHQMINLLPDYQKVNCHGEQGEAAAVDAVETFSGFSHL